MSVARAVCFVRVYRLVAQTGLSYWPLGATAHGRLKCIHLTTPALPRPSQKENIMELIKAVAEDPETLATLVRLLQQLLVDPGTQKSLLELLAWVFKDPYTQENLLGLLYVTLRGTVE